MRRFLDLAAVGALAGALAGLAELATGARGGLVGLALVAGGGLVIGAVEGGGAPAEIRVARWPRAALALMLVALGLAFADANLLVRRYTAVHAVLEVAGFAAFQAAVLF